jgi:hypothetical protein
MHHLAGTSAAHQNELKAVKAVPGGAKEKSTLKAVKAAGACRTGTCMLCEGQFRACRTGACESFERRLVLAGLAHVQAVEGSVAIAGMACVLGLEGD